MRIIQMGDLHLGKILEGHSLLSAQRDVLLHGVLDAIKKKKADVLLLCGDVFEDIYPDDVAMSVFNQFLRQIRQHFQNVLIIAGNHDNSAIFDFMSSFLADSGIYVFGHPHNALSKVTLFDDNGPVNFYALPFLKMQYLTSFLHPLSSDGVSAVFLSMLSRTNFDVRERNVLIAHQYVYSFEEARNKCIITEKQPDMIDISCVNAFDYVALGHIHEPILLKKNILYSGSPYPMHYTDQDVKCLSYVDLGRKGEFQQEFIPIDHQELRIRIYETTSGTFTSLPKDEENYVYVLFDCDVVPEPIAREVEARYPKFCRILGKNTGLRNNLFSKSIQERNVENFDSSSVALKIGKGLVDKESLYIKTMITKIKSNFNI